jgi:hypothetical protein
MRRVRIFISKFDRLPNKYAFPLRPAGCHVYLRILWGQHGEYQMINCRRTTNWLHPATVHSESTGSCYAKRTLLQLDHVHYLFNCIGCNGAVRHWTADFCANILCKLSYQICPRAIEQSQRLDLR